jgi:carbamoyl-phosphate synthase small subunit
MAGRVDVAEALALARGFEGLAGMDLAKVVSATANPMSGPKASGNSAAASRRTFPPPAMSLPTTSASSATSCACWSVAVVASRSCRRRRRPADVLAMNPDGIFLSNGPGDPEPCDYAIEAIRDLSRPQLPTFGICLGHQLMGLGQQAPERLKMKFGHHGANHPVKDLDTGRVLITSQNHGFAVDPATLPANLRRYAHLAVRRQSAGAWPGPIARHSASRATPKQARAARCGLSVRQVS